MHRQGWMQILCTDGRTMCVMNEKIINICGGEPVSFDTLLRRACYIKYTKNTKLKSNLIKYLYVAYIPHKAIEDNKVTHPIPRY